MKYLTIFVLVLLLTACEKNHEDDSYSDSFVVNNMDTCLMRVITEYQHCIYTANEIEYKKLCIIAYSKMIDDCKQIYLPIKANG